MKTDEKATIPNNCVALKETCKINTNELIMTIRKDKHHEMATNHNNYDNSRNENPRKGNNGVVLNET